MKKHQVYEAPSTEVLEVAQGGAVCASEVKGRSSINNWVDGGSTDDELYL